MSPVIAMLLLHGHLLTLHLLPAAQPNQPLLVYATGDGGWRGKDLHTFEQLASWGYPIAGFSSPDYLKHLGPGTKITTPDQLAQDYSAVVAFATTNLALPAGTPVVLVGVSRGAGLAVVAAGQPALQHLIEGVVAVGLTDAEESVQVADLYGYLPRLNTLPVAVVQSAHDHWVPAATARLIFGPNTPTRRLSPVEAKDHNFSNARPSMYNAIKESLNWLVAQLPSSSRF